MPRFPFLPSTLLADHKNKGEMNHGYERRRLQELAENARIRIEESEGLDKLNDVRVAYLGKKGELTAILKGMKDVSPEERPKVGQLVNETRAKIEGLLEESRQKLEEAVREEKMQARGHRRNSSCKENQSRPPSSQHHRPGRGGAYLHRNGL